MTSDASVEKVARVVAAYVQFNRIAATDIPTLVQSVHRALLDLKDGPQASAGNKPAVSVKKSISDDFIICLEDGARLTMLKRYLRTHHNMSPEEYRKKWDLPHDYPMVAPSYARLRSAFAKKIGLGRIPTGKSRPGRK